MSARAGILVTGTEVLTGRVADRNGPWVADRLLELGVELAHLTICGDRFADIEAQLRFLRSEGVDLIVTTGGLGPTADDMTVAAVASFCGLELVLDEAMEARIGEIVARWMARFPDVDAEALRAANRKQAMVPVGAEVLDPVGTAPGVVVPGEPTVVVLPGPPKELQGMWAAAVSADAVRQALAGRTVYRQETVLMFGVAESGLAETLREAERLVTGFEELEITTCLRRGELEVSPATNPAGSRLTARCWNSCGSGTAPRSSPRTARESMNRWPGCWRAGGSPPRNRVPRGCWPRGWPTGRVRPPTSSAGWSPTPTRRRWPCSVWMPR